MVNLPRPSLFDEDAIDEDEEAEFAEQCRLSDEAELEALCRYGVDRWDLFSSD